MNENALHIDTFYILNDVNANNSTGRPLSDSVDLSELLPSSIPTTALSSHDIPYQVHSEVEDNHPVLMFHCVPVHFWKSNAKT